MLAELEFDKVRVDVFALAVQAPSCCDPETSIYKQSTSELATSVPPPEKVLLVVEVK